MEEKKVAEQLKKACNLVKGEWFDGANWCVTPKLDIKYDILGKSIKIEDKSKIKALKLSMNTKDIDNIQVTADCIEFNSPKEYGKFPNSCAVCVGKKTEALSCSGNGEKTLLTRALILKK